jgi:hypothetical protein
MFHLNPQRELLDDQAIYRLYYSGSVLSESEVIELWHEIADTLNMPAGMIRPSDVFGKDIGRGLITTEELDELYCLGSKRAKSLGLPIDFLEIRTVDDYIKAFIKT